MKKWIKDILILNNIIDFSPHSYWASSRSKAKNMDVNIDEILKQGCWKNQKNLLIYHDKIVSKYAPDKIDFNRICRV